MKIYIYIKGILLVLVALMLTSCTDDDFGLLTDGEEKIVTFSPSISSNMASRSIGDAGEIDKLTVAVYEVVDSSNVKSFFQTCDWSVAKNNGISLTLIEGRTYNILFWAYDNDNTAYALTDDGNITINYEDYTAGGFFKMEQLDAFYAVAKVTIGTQKVENKGDISLVRPLAQVNFADNTTTPIVGSHKTLLTYNDYPKSFNPFSGSVVKCGEPITFTFADYPVEVLKVDNVDYYYVSSNYFFAPASGNITVGATLDFQDMGGTTIKRVELDNDAIKLEKNKKTNVLGSIVQQPEAWSVWDGESKTEPTKDSQNRYIIDEAADIAWLSENGATLSENQTFLQTKDIDMNNNAIASIKLPAGSTYDGGEKTIKNYTNSLFGDVTALTVKDLVVENITASGATHVGVLVNTLKGSSSFTNVSVASSSATTANGAAGGVVGYVVRKSQKDRNETLDVSFSNCKLNGVTVSGSSSEGKFVGLLSGYDNNESLSFDADCEAADVSVADYTSVYTKANNSAWVASDVTNKYDGWLGHETYRRAKVTFGGVRLAPRWDGSTVIAKADLLLYNGESNKYEVHSPFDLAGVRNATASPAALYLMENVDMYGQGADGVYYIHNNFTKSAQSSTDDNNFTAFSSIDLLEGNNNSIYNLALNSQGSDRYAFIIGGNNGNIHRNISFHNCCTVVPHVVGTDNGQTVDKSYGATVVLSVGGATYTMDNVHAYGCKVFALQKTAILAGRLVSATMATINNCSVNNCYIENYNCQEHKELFEESIVSAEFYSYGEIGALTGFINFNATITNCSVNNTEINAYGQSDQKGNIGGVIKVGTIPGRHVNQFIGDIRSKEGYTISVSDCSVSGNSYSQDSHSHSKGTSVPVIGEAYCLGAKIFIIGQKGDKKGTVTVQNITVDGSKKFTSKTSVTLQELM